MRNQYVTRAKTGALALTVAGLACGCAAAGGASAASTKAHAAKACQPRHTDLKTVAAGKLLVNAYVSPPYTDQNGNSIGGVDGMIVKKLGAMECLSVSIKSVAGAALPASIQSNRADIAIGGVYYSKQRAQEFDLTVPMYKDGLGLLSKNGVSTLAGLKTGTLGVIQGYLWNAEFQKALGTSHVRIYQTSASLISDIENGRVTAGAFTSAEAYYRAAHGTALKAKIMSPTPQIVESQSLSNVVLLLNKHATTLTRALNADIKVLLKDGFIAKVLRANGISASLVAKA